MKNIKLLSFLFVLVFIALSCKNDQNTVYVDEMVIRIPSDPEKLNPVFNPSAVGREIFQYIFVPLADFHPESMELVPILIEKLPTTTFDREGLIGYEMKFKQDATWPDGKDITAEDYIFTIKAIKHPQVNTAAWRQYLNYIKDIQTDPKDPKRLTVYVDKEFMLSLEVAVTFQILPKHIYDPKGQLDSLSFDDLVSEESIEAAIEKDSSLTHFATAFNDPKNYRENLVGSGPYYLKEKEANSYFILEKNPDYWGNKYPEIPFLNGNIKTLKFTIVPDELTALTAFKDQNIDLMKIKNSDLFHDFISTEKESQQFNFFTPKILAQQYFALNNENVKLKERNVRRALAHLLDVQDIIQTLDHGYGTQSVGPFHPSKTYYNKDLKTIGYDLDKAKDLLTDSGWIDSDNDGDVDKIIDDKMVDLELELLISGSDLSNKVALLFQESAKKAGVRINIVAKDFRLIRNEHLKTKNFDMVASLAVTDAAPDDPYSYWHSDNAVPGKRNVFSFKNDEADDLIEKIRTTKDAAIRKGYYLKLQEIIYEDQPAIFLYAPTEKILLNKKFIGSGTPKRPGYLANTFKSK